MMVRDPCILGVGTTAGSMLDTRKSNLWIRSDNIYNLLGCLGICCVFFPFI